MSARRTAGRALLAGSLVALACARPAAGPAPRPQSPEAWADSTLATLSLEAKVGQMLFGRTLGDFDNVQDADFAPLLGAVEELGLGGVAISVGSPPEVAGKANALQRAARLPLLVAADLEYGPGMRLWSPVYLPYGFEGGGGTVFPYNMGLGAAGDPALAETAGRVTAREARAVGIHWIFGPTLDVNNNPANPVINIRSYGSDPELAGRMGAAFVRGAHAAGAMTAAKHFPGHGDTGIDSHLELPRLDVTRARMDSVELPPFRTAIAAGVDGVMTGHLAVPALTGGRTVPATVSAELTHALLQEELGFRGLVVTDAMTMGALRRLPGWTPGRVAVMAVEAGADVVLSAPDLHAAHRDIVRAVRAGRIAESRIDASVRKILRAKARLGLHRRRFVDLDSVGVIVASPEHERAAAEAAERSIVLVRDPGGVVPLDPRRVRSVAAVAYAAPMDLTAGRPLFAELGRIYGEVRSARIDEETPAEEVEAALRRAAGADAVVLATYLSPVSGKGHLRVPERARELARRLAETGKPMVVVSFGDPYGPASLDPAGAYMLAWQPRGHASGRAAARALAGRAAVTGRLPIELPGAPRGAGLHREPLERTLPAASAGDVGMAERGLERVDSILRAGIAGGAAPGAALAVGRHGRLVRLRGYGVLDPRPGFGPATDSTLYDIASLTKVVGTTTMAMMMVDAGRLDLDAPVRRYLPEWSGAPAKEAVTVRQLLTHTAGLPAYGPLWRELRGKEAYLERIAAMELAYEPGTETVYSDFGVIALGAVLERLAGTTIDAFLAERVFGPLGMADTRYNPTPGCAQLAPPEAMGRWTEDGGTVAAKGILARIAPTEVDTVFRGVHVHGIVHDENACAMGGVAPHAGLFSSARDLAVFAQMLLDEGEYGGVRLIRPETVRMFTRRQSESSSRALGWDTPSGRSSAGDYFSARSFGHTGFTGTSLWIDPERDLFVVLLTNRVNPTRENSGHVPLRRAVHDAVAQAVTDVVVEER